MLSAQGALEGQAFTWGPLSGGTCLSVGAVIATIVFRRTRGRWLGVGLALGAWTAMVLSSLGVAAGSADRFFVAFLASPWGHPRGVRVGIVPRGEPMSTTLTELIVIAELDAAR
jgi:hypothetical protein